MLVAVVDHGNLTQAARQLGKSLQAVSRALAALEQELGVQLIARTTRRSTPTAAGLVFAQRMRAALADIELARDDLADEGAKIGGRVRVGASTLFGPRYVAPALAAAIERRPELEIELALTDQHVDLFSEGLDIAVRIGTLPDSSLVARRIGALRRVICAAPGYLAARGRPRRPADLVHHECVMRCAPSATEAWTLGVNGTWTTIEVRGRFRSDSAAARNEAAALGLGINLAPLWQVRSLLDEGRLDLLLIEHEPPPVLLHLVWPSGQIMARRTRVVADLLASRLREAVVSA